MVLKALETKKTQKNISLIFLGFLSESKCYLECIKLHQQNPCSLDEQTAMD